MAVQQAPNYFGRLVCLVAFFLFFHSGYSTFERKEAHISEPWRSIIISLPIYVHVKERESSHKRRTKG